MSISRDSLLSLPDALLQQVYETREQPQIVLQQPLLMNDVHVDQKAILVSVMPLVDAERQGVGVPHQNTGKLIEDDMNKKDNAPRAWWRTDYSLADPEQRLAHKRREHK